MVIVECLVGYDGRCKGFHNNEEEVKYIN